MSHEGIDVERQEFEQLRREIADVRHLVERTRIVLHGEDGTNGLRASVERAHKAISGLQSNIKVVHDGVAVLTLSSATGDKEMEIKVISELKALEDKMRERHEVERRWKIGQTVAICIGVAGVIVSIVL